MRIQVGPIMQSMHAGTAWLYTRFIFLVIMLAADGLGCPG
jgi:hypothetical protein